MRSGSSSGGPNCADRLWFAESLARLQLDAHTTFENHPHTTAPASAWNHTVYAFAEPVKMERGEVAIISAVHDRKIPWFALEKLESRS